ncbi:hypothetical protein Hanom_Chr01g00037341 [Helianthus anomalus]
MGFDEHRENWRRTYGREPTWKELFLQTHLTKECKEKLRKGEISIYDMKNLKFCTNRSKEVYVYGSLKQCKHNWQSLKLASKLRRRRGKILGFILKVREKREKTSNNT